MIEVKLFNVFLKAEDGDIINYSALSGQKFTPYEFFAKFVLISRKEPFYYENIAYIAATMCEDEFEPDREKRNGTLGDWDK